MSAVASSTCALPYPNPKLPRQTQVRTKTPPLSISTNAAHLDPAELRQLLHSCGHSCHRLSINGFPDPVDLAKLRLALAHSSIVVSVYARIDALDEDFRLFRMPAESGRRLVGFGRAISDGGLTASIHDVVVFPSLRRRGIGRKIVHQITRILASRGIYDISALCSKQERSFFEACGFGDDSLGATTMMYTGAVHGSSQNIIR